MISFSIAPRDSRRSKPVFCPRADQAAGGEPLSAAVQESGGHLQDGLLLPRLPLDLREGQDPARRRDGLEELLPPVHRLGRQDEVVPLRHPPGQDPLQAVGLLLPFLRPERRRGSQQSSTALGSQVSRPSPPSSGTIRPPGFVIDLPPAAVPEVVELESRDRQELQEIRRRPGGVRSRRSRIRPMRGARTFFDWKSRVSRTTTTLRPGRSGGVMRDSQRLSTSSRSPSVTKRLSSRSWGSGMRAA